MPTDPAPRLLHIVGDESSHRGNHRFLVYGTVSCERDKVPLIVEEIENAKQGKSMEWHWSEFSYPELYLGLIDTIFRCRKEHGLRFRCLVVNTRHARHKEYSNNDPDLGLEKYLHRHLMTYANDQKLPAQFYVQLDKRTEKYSAASQRYSLNNADRRDNKRKYDLFAEATDVHSHTSPMVQVADVLAGVVAYVKNERYLAQVVGSKKLAVAERVARLANIPIVGLAKEAGIQRGEFGLWHSRRIRISAQASSSGTCIFGPRRKPRSGLSARSSLVGTRETPPMAICEMKAIESLLNAPGAIRAFPTIWLFGRITVPSSSQASPLVVACAEIEGSFISSR
jgi:hypothetical protein